MQYYVLFQKKANNWGWYEKQTWYNNKIGKIFTKRKTAHALNWAEPALLARNPVINKERMPYNAVMNLQGQKAFVIYVTQKDVIISAI